MAGLGVWCMSTGRYSCASVVSIALARKLPRLRSPRQKLKGYSLDVRVRVGPLGHALMSLRASCCMCRALGEGVSSRGLGMCPFAGCQGRQVSHPLRRLPPLAAASGGGPLVRLVRAWSHGWHIEIGCVGCELRI